MAAPTLEGASITFHTNDEDKDHDTDVHVVVRAGTIVAAEIHNQFGHFDDNSDSGPFDLLVVNPLTRDELKVGNVEIKAESSGLDTWRFNFLLDLRFSDGSHLIARANGLEMIEILTVAFGIV
jgi:hypothetical protein